MQNNENRYSTKTKVRLAYSSYSKRETARVDKAITGTDRVYTTSGQGRGFRFRSSLSRFFVRIISPQTPDMVEDCYK
jgi:hypothetical protein